jgi:hypothetical protein
MISYDLMNVERSQKPEVPLNQDMNTIFEQVEIIKKIGFGEIRVQIRNGSVYRILSTEDRLLQKE